MRIMRHSRNFLLVVTLVFTCVASQAQTGTIQGRLTEEVAGVKQPIPFANVLVAGTTNGATTDMEGRYSFQAPVGTQQVVFSFIGYETDTVPGIVVREDQMTTLDHVLGAKGIDMAEFEVVQKVDRERETVLLMDRKESTALVQNIGSQELKKKGANDVADGVKKVVGLSIVGDRYLMVRGMGDRYNSAYLNGLPLPSPDPDSKVAPLDIFSTNVVGNISVTKAFTPDLYGDFAGGAVDIRTKTATDEDILQVSVGGGMNTRTTFREHLTYNGGGSDFWGFDDGTRKLPLGFGGLNPVIEDESVPFKQNFNPVSSTARPDMNFGVFAGTGFSLTQDIRLNVVLSGSYRNEYRYRDGKNRIINTSNVALIDYDFESHQFNTQTSALGTVGLEIGKRHQISYTSLLANISSDETRVNRGYHFDYQYDVYARRYTFRQNKVRVDQVHGTHAFGIADRLQVKWDASMSQANSNEPDRRQLVYLYEPGASETDYLFNGQDRIENHRWYSALKEKETAAHAAVSYRLLQREIEGEMTSLLTVHAGADRKDKRRNFRYDLWVYDLSNTNVLLGSPVNVNTPDSYLDDVNFANGVFSVQNATTPDARHTIEQEIMAGYGSVEVDLIPRKLKVMGGARYEDGGQRIYYRRQSDGFFEPIRVARIDAADILPYASVKYDINSTNVLRLSGSKTITRPGFREMAPFEYTEFFAGIKNVGNPLLRNGSVINADARYEVYPSPGELLAIGVFGKSLTDPIEKVALATASGQLQSFANTEGATIAGVELEVVKNLAFLDRADTSFLNDLSLGFNASFLYSNAVIGRPGATADGASLVLTNLERPLQGASPYLLNADLSYTRVLGANFKGVATLAYNVYGRRVFAVGANGLGDQYELPMGQLNLILRGDIGERWQANINVRNLTDAQYRIEQEAGDSSTLLNTYRTGTGISFGLSYRII